MALRVMRSLEEWARDPADTRGPLVLTVGNFDGLHVGHRRLLRAVAERARAANGRAAALTFDPHPLKILRPAEAPPLLMTLEQRLAEFAEEGMDAALVLRFDTSVARISPEEFVKGILVERMGMREIFVGDNFRFGHKQGGNVALLEELGGKLGFRVEIVPPVVVRGQVVSSSAVRNAVLSGRMAEAGRLLGRPYVLAGEIRPGTGQGRRLLFPTLNLNTPQEVLPGKGVYATETKVGGRKYLSATNVGLRPTFDGKQLTVESHLFDFAETMAAGPMEVFFWKRLRDERKFAGVEALRAQIERDVARTREFFRRLERRRGEKAIQSSL